MDSKEKKVLGVILGELYEIKCLLKKKTVDIALLFALKNGFESEINDQLNEEWFVSKEDEKKVADVLTPYFDDPVKLEKLSGFYDIERELEELGIQRLKAICIMKYFWTKGSFIRVLERMDTSSSPEEARTFNITEFDI